MQGPLLRAGPADRHRLATRVRRGELVRLHRGIYAPAPLARTPQIRAAAAIAAIPDAVVSHDTAAAVWDIELVRSSGLDHVTVPLRLRRASRSTLVVHASDLPAREIGHWLRIPVTSPARTVRDLLRCCDRLTSVWMVEQVLRWRWVQREELLAGLRSRQGRSCCLFADPLSESPLETGIRLVLLDGGLPAPDLQIPVRNGTFRVDLGYRQLRIGIEADGRATHDAPAAIYADRWRANALHESGWRLLRFTWRDLVERPDYIVATVRRALAAAA